MTKKEIQVAEKKQGFYVGPTGKFCYVKKTSYGFEVHYKESSDPIYFSKFQFNPMTEFSPVEDYFEQTDPETETHVKIDGKTRGVFFSALDAFCFLKAQIRAFEYVGTRMAKEHKRLSSKEFQMDIVGLGTYLHEVHSIDTTGVYTKTLKEIGQEYMSYKNSLAGPYGQDYYFD